GNRSSSLSSSRADRLDGARQAQPLGPVVDVEALAAQQAYQGDADAPRELDRQTARRGHRADDRHPRRERLLEDLVARPAAHEDDPLAPGQLPGEERRADQLVESVVAADV